MSNFKQWLIIGLGFLAVWVGAISIDNFKFKDTSKKCLKEFNANPYSFDKQKLIYCRYITGYREVGDLTNRQAVDYVINRARERLK